MLFLLKYKFDPDHAHQVLALWKQFQYPSEVRLIHRYLVIGRHMSVAIFDAPDAQALLEITAPFANFGIAKIAPIMPIEDAIRM